MAECNDGYLNDIQAMAVTEADACAALDAAGIDFASGAVGAGAGMSCFGFKGGIGTASAAIVLDGVPRRLGVLALCNFGRAGDLRLPGGRRAPSPAALAPENGSVVVVMATDIPMEHRQLARVVRRGGVGLARAGSFWGHGSGDLFVGFSTANRTPVAAPSDLLPMQVLAEPRIDRLFEAMADVTEQAVLHALTSAETTVGHAGHVRHGLRSVGKSHACRPALIAGLYRLEIDLNAVAMADLAAIILVAEPLGPRTVAFAATEIADVLGWINTVSVLAASLR